MEMVMPVSQRVIVLDGGEKIAEGLPGEIVRNDRGDQGLFRGKIC